ncbi:MAG: hypothetical protein IH868_10855, partial [Chloroflexi bacterium]|nr:hypothetical protein [Chloroflexota bacterium]
MLFRISGSQTRRVRLTTVALALVAISAFAIIACGGDDEPSAPLTQATQPPEPTTTPE